MTPLQRAIVERIQPGYFERQATALVILGVLVLLLILLSVNCWVQYGSWIC